MTETHTHTLQNINEMNHFQQGNADLNNFLQKL